jgi:hypothetical protein
MTFDFQPDAQRLNDPALTPVLRWIASLMCLPALCARPACRRARACRGEPRRCLKRYAPLVPEDAREGLKAMIAGREQGLSFDGARDQHAEIDDLLAWRELVHRCAARSR